jgi:lipopolysaccharide transport system ATP-binding protein
MTKAISVEGLSKRYAIGVRQKRSDTLVIAAASAFIQPLRNLARIRRLTSVGEDLGETDDSIWALRDVSFDVEEGTAIGIIGRNGAGKSTLLKILSRITAPTIGRATIRGKVSSLLEVGTGFHPELTGRENVYLNGSIHGMNRREIAGKFDEIVDFSGVEKLIDTPVKRFSSGMTVRLAFAVAANLEPDVLIVDEVLAVGDAEFQRKCLGKMESTALTGRTVLFVSHNMAAVTRLCSSAVWLDQGKVVRIGPTSKIASSYLMGDGGRGAIRQWDLDSAPGGDVVRLLEASVKNDDGQIISVSDVRDGISISMRYKVLADEASFRCNVNLFTQGIQIFNTLEPSETVRTGPKDYLTTVHIPPHLLAEGEHSVSISLFTSRGAKERFVSEQDVVGFQIVDSMDGDSARGDYAQNMGGFIQPRLEWESE